MSRPKDLGVAELFFLAQACIFGSGLILFGFTSFVRFIVQIGSGVGAAAKGPLAPLQPLLSLLRVPVEMVYGRAASGSSSYGLTDILLAALLLVLLGMWRTQHQQVVLAAAGARGTAIASATGVRSSQIPPAATSAAVASKKD
jgi:hypothetical protein